MFLFIFAIFVCYKHLTIPGASHEKILLSMIVCQILLQACGSKDDEIVPESPYEVTTLAGDGTAGYSDGKGSEAKFNYPKGIAVDAQGNVYVADSFNQRIRKITPDGTVSTLAGSDPGDADGKGTTAKFNRPVDIDIDENGDLYVTDQLNLNIRKIKPDGTVTTLAGKGPYNDFKDGPVLEARFRKPSGIAIDGKGYIWVGDDQASKLRVISPDGLVSTVAGGASGYIDGTGSSAGFISLAGLAVDANNNILVTDLGYGLRKVTPDGKVTTLVAQKSTGHKDGDLASALFNTPRGIAVDNHNVIYLTEGVLSSSSNNGPSPFDAWIRMITSDGTVSSIAGGEHGFADGSGNKAQFFAPNGIAVDANGTIYVADELNHAIRKIVLRK